MKRNYTTKFSLFVLGLIVLALTVFSGRAYSQTTYTFNYTGSTQTISLPAGSYSIEMWGADGGSGYNGTNTVFGGKGGYARGTYTTASTTTLNIYVGGHGGNASGAAQVGGGGGGMSDVAPASNTNIVIIAAGGGGGGTSGGTTNENSIGGDGGGLVGGTSIDGTGVTGGTAATGGSQSAGGFATAGSYGAGTPGGYGYGGGAANGGTAGVMHSAGGNGGNGGNGGWNGGGGGCTLTGINDHAAGGGAGYYGGGGGRGDGGAGGGGSSYIGGVSSAATFSFGQTGFLTNPDLAANGKVFITELCSISLVASSSNSLNPTICSGQSLTLTTNAISNFSWSTGATSSSLVVSPTTNTVYALTATSPSNCIATRNISVTVSSSLPVLSIANPSANICLGVTVSLTATGAVSYTWTNPGIVNGQPFTPNATAAYTVSGQNGCGITVATTTITVAPLAVTISASPTVVCQGYASTLTAFSAVSNYTWEPGTVPGSLIVVSPVANTLYTVIATDGTCSGTQTVLLTTKVTPTITAVTTASSICLGEPVTLTASGAGTGGSYSWTPGGAGVSINPAPATSTVYTVAGTNSVGCSAQAQQVVVVNLPPNMNVSAVANKTLICDGQSATLTASGATGYSWVSGPPTAGYTVTPTAAVTVYTVNGTHQTNTCVATRTIAVSVITPSVTLSSTVSTCAGLDAVLTASGATSYSWNGFATPGGSYTTTPPATANFTLLTLTTIGLVSCPMTYTALVIVNPTPTITVTPDRPGICKGESTKLTAIGASTYDWGAGVGTGSAVTVSPTATLIYTVTGTNANGCKGTTYYSAKVNSCLGINESSFDLVLSVFPNPSSGEFRVSAEKDINLELINELGQHLRSITLNAVNNHEVKLNDLATGIYFLKSEDGEVKLSQKIVIMK